MLHELFTTAAPASAEGNGSARQEEAGRAAAQSHRVIAKRMGRGAHTGDTARRLRSHFDTAVRGQQGESTRWLADNMRLIRTAMREIRDIDRSLRNHPMIHDDSGVEVARTCAVAQSYLAAAGNRFSEAGLQAFLDGYQAIAELEMGEIWALKPALQKELLERLASNPPEDWPNLIISLRRTGEAQWKELFECVSVVDRVLAQDPAAAYRAMDYESRDAYRKAVSNLAKHSGHSEGEVAQAAIQLASAARKAADGGRYMARRTHAGFYLVDEGVAQLRAKIGYRPPLRGRVSDFLLRNPSPFYMLGIELVTFVIVVGLLSVLDTGIPLLGAFLLLILPATQAAVEILNNLTTSLVPPRSLPKLDFSKGIPADCATIVAVPTLLLQESQVRDLVLDLEIRYLANRDPNLYFALLTDSPDSDQAVDKRDPLANVCSQLIDGLNRRYGTKGRGPFYLFHRHRVFNESEGRWMGWERKRGKLLDLNQLIRGGFDSFPVKTGDLSVLPRLRYVITLDSDTQLPRGSAARLVGAMAHPLNRAVVDPHTKMAVEGYGILQPRIGISVESASRSRLAALYSGQTGFDIYTRAVSDVYQDLFGEGIFTGKGIYEIEPFMQTLQQRFPENALLSHDLIEGAYARAALVSDIELIDDYPSHFSAYSRRRHRWLRGDWQILRWLWPRVPDYYGRIIPNPINLISRWKIFDNLRRSLIEPVTLALFLAAWVYLPGSPLYWTSAIVALLFMPAYASFLFSLLRIPWRSRRFGSWARDSVGALLKGNIAALLSLVFLLHQALYSMDAIVRSVLRVFVTKRKLLEWETAAEAEAAARKKSTVDIYLEWTPLAAAAMGLVIGVMQPDSLAVAAPVLLGWFASRGISDFLNRPPRTSNRELRAKDAELVRDSAERIWRYFHDWSSPATNWLIPDSVREDGTMVPRLSPTNLGLLLNARIAALHFGFLSLTEFVFATRQTLDRLCELPKYRGHLLNWYDIERLEPLEPRFVSTVDSGNLAACLWTLKQAALSFAAEAPSKGHATPALAAELASIAEICERLVQEMDFTFLYQQRNKVLSVGYDASTERLERSSYDLLASESRIASFIAIAKGEIPQEAWFHLGRAHTMFRGERVLVSWTGTMFEYLMPALWMRHYADTITELSASAAVRAQREFARRKGVPWGISESACRDEEGEGYAAFGIPELAMKRMDSRRLVISPYSTFLALGVDPHEAVENIRRIQEFGWSGRYGCYEAVDYSTAGGEVIRSWMAHHQGMSLLAACNLLFGNPLQQYFHAEPHVMATELLLHERVPRGIEVEPEEASIPAAATAPASA